MVMRKWLIGLFSFISFFGQMNVVHALGTGAKSYRIHITNVNRVTHKNWLRVPNTVDCTVTWQVYEEKKNGLVPVDISSFSMYRVICKGKDKSIEKENQAETKGNFYTFYRRKVGEQYSFIVEGYVGNKLKAVSDTLRVQTGRLRADSRPSNISRWPHWIPFNGRILLAIIGRARFFDGATKAGKIAFHLIWNFLLAGLIIWFFFCIPQLRLGRVFPLENGFILGKSYDKVYERGESKEFRAIIEGWRDIVKKANKNIRQELWQAAKTNIDDIEGANAEYWRDEGSDGIRDLISRISRPSMKRFPAARIIQAGLENHELGGFHWMEVSKEVDRAIENRASSELERLKRKTLLDWLWNLGTLAPLIGLFGTATGISNAFATLTFLRADITQTDLVKRLAGGIYEALWTTIEGLFVGIFLMLLYYYYQNKLNWIYSKWEEIYVYVTERL